MEHEVVLQQQREAPGLGSGAAWARASVGRRLGVITALPNGADCLRDLAETPGLAVATTGGDPGRALAAAQALADAGVAGLVSFGPALGLAPVLRPGDVVVAEAVVLPSGEAIGTDHAWRGRLVERLVEAGVDHRVARIVGRDRLLASVAERRRAFQATVAAALDTESHGVAEVASSVGLPLLVVRAVADPVEESRPGATVGACADGAHVGAMHLVARCATRPWRLPAAWRFNQNGRLALEALRQVTAAGPEPFAF